MKNLIALIKKSFALLLLSFIAGNVLPAIALANYGNPCASLPVTIDSYLSSESAYGIVKQNIDISSWATGGCNMSDDQFHICVKKAPPAVPSDCDPYAIQVGSSTALSNISNNPEFGAHPNLKDITLDVEIIDDLACLTMETSRGKMPLFCRNATTAVIEDYTPENTCVSIGTTCFNAEPKKSQSLFNFSGLVVECMISTLHSVFFLGEDCMHNEEFFITSVASFAEFQGTLRNTVFLALTIYVIFFGFKLALSPEIYIAPNQSAIAFFKLILVMYFAAGLGPITWDDGVPTQENGFTKYVMPFLIGATSSFAQMTFNSVDANGLCVYDPSSYASGYGYYSLWDSIDCRLSYYLGFAPVMNVVEFFSGHTATNVTDYGVTGQIDAVIGSTDVSHIVKAGDFTYLALTWFFVLGGNLIAVICMGFMFIVLITMTSNFVMLFIVCIITIYVMAYLSPIFITFYLFEQTREYFNSWLRITVSCALQPAVLGGVVALLFTMYDNAYFGNCPFKGYDYEIGDRKIRIFQMLSPVTDKDDCENRFAYKLKRLYNGEGDETLNAFLIKINYIVDSVGMTISAIYMLIMTMIFYYMFKSMFDFAADITNGPNVAAQMFALPKMPKKDQQQQPGGAQDKVATGGMGAQDKAATGGSGATDAVATGSKRAGGVGAQDKAATGGGKASAASNIKSGGQSE